MHAEGPPDAGRRDELVHEVRLLLSELCELVAYDEEMWHRVRHFPHAEEPGVIVDVVHAVHIKGLLPSVQLRLHGDEGPEGLVAVQVRDDPEQMGKAAEGLRHAAALVIDEEEARVIGRKVQGKGEDKGRDEDRLARARSAGDEPVRAVRLFVEVEEEELILRARPYGHGERTCRVRPCPAFQHADVLHGIRAVHVKEGESVGEPGSESVHVVDNGKVPGEPFVGNTFVSAEVEGLTFRRPALQDEPRARCVQGLRDRRDGVGEARGNGGRIDHRIAKLFLPAPYVVHDRVRLAPARLVKDEDEMRQEMRPPLRFPVLELRLPVL